MTANWNNPTTSSQFADVLTELKNRDLSLANLDYTGDSNLPTGAKRYYTTTKRLQSWNGSTWDDLQIGNIADDAVATAAIVANAVSESKIRLSNNTFLRSRNAANSADLSIIKSDASDNSVLNTPTGKIISLRENDVEKWKAAADIIPAVTDSQKLGAASFRLAEAWLQKISLCTEVNSSGAALALKTLSANGIEIYLNSTKKWEYDSNGHYLPGTTDNVNIGSATKKVLESWLTKISLCGEINNSGNSLLLKTLSSHGIGFYINNTSVWAIGSDGNLVPVGSRGFGSSGARVNSLYGNTADFSGNVTVGAQLLSPSGSQFWTNAVKANGDGSGNGALAFSVRRASSPITALNFPYQAPSLGTAACVTSFGNQAVGISSDAGTGYVTWFVNVNGTIRALRLYDSAISWT